jgi:tight adherence protein C
MKQALDALTTFDPAALLRPYVLTIALMLVFLTVVLAVLGSSALIADRDAVKRRLRESAGGVDDAADPAVSLRFKQGAPTWLRLFQPLYQWLLPKDAVFVSSARLKLVHAGYVRPGAVATFYALKIVVAAVSGIGALVLVPMLMRNIEPAKAIPIAGVAAIIGYLVPAWVLDLQTSKRKRLIKESIPDALDLLLICVEAGLGLDAAIARVGGELGAAHAIIAEQLRLVGAELRAGKSREEALRGLGERTGVDDIRMLVTLLIQSDELGTSIGQALRVYAFELRAKRLLTAEEKAHKIPVKLAFPLMFGLIPVVMIVTLAPAVIKILTFLVPALGRGTFGGGHGG